MKLADYIENNNLTCKQFAQLIEVANAGTVHRYAIGKRIPRSDIMAKIQEVTDGKVSAADFYPTPAQPSKVEARAGP